MKGYVNFMCTKADPSVSVSRQHRSSNIELLRIISMLAIIAHHYVVNSGIQEHFTYGSFPGASMLFLQLWGMWGKTAINVFVLISGYFMCTSALTWKRFLKVYLEVKFYLLLGYFCFVLSGYTAFHGKQFLRTLFSTFTNVNSGFTSSFLWFYLFIPFYNAVIDKLGKEGLQKLIVLLLLLFSVTSTVFFNETVFHYVGWYMTLYFISSYIRLYPMHWSESKRVCSIGLALCVFSAFVTILFGDCIGTKYGLRAYHFLIDSNKILALLVALFAFCLFKNCTIPYNKAINLVASTTFGIFLIHANSDAMRSFLWKDLFKVPEMYSAGLLRLAIHAAGSTVFIFLIASCIDLIRIHLIEKPTFRMLTQYSAQIELLLQKSKLTIKKTFEKL